MSQPHQKQQTLPAQTPEKTGPISTMEEYYKAKSRSKIALKRTGAPLEPVIVNAEIYDLVTEGDVNSPLFWDENVPVLDGSRLTAAQDLLGNNAKIQSFIMG